jgi:hypothetical protein
VQSAGNPDSVQDQRRYSEYNGRPEYALFPMTPSSNYGAFDDGSPAFNAHASRTQGIVMGQPTQYANQGQLMTSPTTSTESPVREVFAAMPNPAGLGVDAGKRGSRSSSRSPSPAPASRQLANLKPKRVRTGCWTCRDRHLKCDEGTPICGKCMKSSRECRYGIRLTWQTPEQLDKIQKIWFMEKPSDWNGMCSHHAQIWWLRLLGCGLPLS